MTITTVKCIICGAATCCCPTCVSLKGEIQICNQCFNNSKGDHEILNPPTSKKEDRQEREIKKLFEPTPLSRFKDATS